MVGVRARVKVPTKIVRSALLLSAAALLFSACGEDEKTGSTIAVRGALGSPIPFALMSNIPVAEVAINGQPPKHFIVDTGAQLVLIDTAYGREIGFETALFPKALDTLTVGELTFEQVPAIAYDLSDLTAMIGVKIDGFLGANLFEQFTVAFDYKEEQLYFLDPESDEAALELSARGDLELDPRTLTGELNLGFLLVDTTFEATAPPHQMLVDTGAAATVLIESAFEQLDIPAERARIPGIEGVGQVGMLMLELLRSCNVRAGEAEVNNMLLAVAPDALLSQATLVLPRLKGLLGYTFLREFLVVLDYRDTAARLYPFTETPHIDPNELAGVGVLPVRKNGGVFVGAVIAGSDAQAKGVAVDDQILRIDGLDAASLSDADLSDGLSGELGDVRTLELERGDQEMTLMLQVADLLPGC